MSNMLENPFLNNKNPINYHDDNFDKTVELEQENIAKYFQHVYILTKKTNDPIPIDFYNWQVDQATFEEVASKLLVHKTSVKILKNKHHFDSIVMMSSTQLKPYNIFNYDLGDKNIVLPIFNIEYKNILKYLEQYESSNNLENIYKIKVLNKYFGIEDSNYKSNEYICSVISDMEESKYWTQYYNCLVNFTRKFKERHFTFQSNRIENKTVANLIKELFEKKVTTTSDSDENYIDGMNKKDNFVDISSLIERKGFQFYRIGPKSEFTKLDIIQLFSTLNSKQKFLLFSNMIVSKKYAHLVINNYHILNMMSDTIAQYAPLFKYLFAYAWLRFYFEECIKKSFVKTDDDFIFDINTASKLPIFPFSHKKPKENPYMPILVSDQDLKSYENVCGIPDYISEDKTLINAGISTLDEYKIRMNIFCTGNPNNNLFDGLDFDKHKLAITGSIITACIQKSHPLMSRFAGCDTQTERFTNYFNEYYAKSDIDVMFLAKDTFTFIDNVREFHNTIVLNICKFNSPYAEPSHIKLVLNKLGYIFVSEDFINENIWFDESKQITNKVKYVFDNINDEEIRDKFRPYYEQLKIEKINELTNDLSPDEIYNLKIRYPEIFITDVDFRIYINRTNSHKLNSNTSETDETDETDETSEEHLDTEVIPSVKVFKSIDLVFTYKFKIESPHLNHCFELFPVKYDDFFSIVSRFHLPCVRGYYNGSNVYLTPSCISAHLTFMNIDYKYVAGTKDPIEIINKNRIRGFGTWLNAGERKLFTKYSREVPFWNNLYTIDSAVTDADAGKQLLGPLSLNHKIFRPRLYNMDEYVESMFVDTTNRYSDSQLPPTVYDVVHGNALPPQPHPHLQSHPNLQQQSQSLSIIQERFKSIIINEINFDSLSAIDSNGYIVPLKKWVIDLTWEIANATSTTRSRDKNQVNNNNNDNLNDSKIKKITITQNVVKK